MTLSQIVLFPLTHRVVAETKIAEYEHGLRGLAEFIERQSRLLPAPVKAKRVRTTKKAA